MNNADLRVLSHALAVTHTLIHTSKDAYATLAEGLARHIEDFCRQTVPEAFGNESDSEIIQRAADYADGVITQIKVSTKAERKKLMPKDRNLLLLMHKILEERGNSRARSLYPTELIKRLVSQMIEDEVMDARGRK